MTSQYRARGLMYPAIDPRVDITDHYVFRKPGDPDRIVLATNVNPLAPAHANEFRSDAVYETLIDTDGDARPDVSLRCRFTRKTAGRQFARVTRAVLTLELEDGHIHEELETETLIEDAPVSFGAEPHVTDGANGLRFFAGIRSDPMFFDMAACANGMAFTDPGSDFFADKNVFSIVLEVPHYVLAEEQRLGIWSRTLVPMTMQREHFTQFDQAGRPLVTMFFNDGSDQTLFNRTEPARQRTARNTSAITFLDAFATTIQRAGGYSPIRSAATAQTLLPDILQYDLSAEPRFPNGRRLHDDVVDHMLDLLTDGNVTTDHVGPHTDYLSEFPYLGHPTSDV